MKLQNTNKWFKENWIIIIIALVAILISIWIIRSLIRNIKDTFKRRKVDMPVNPETGVEYTEEEIEMTFNVDYYVETFRKTTDSCWVTCFHRCSNFEILVKELDNAQLVVVNNKYVDAYGKSLIEEMKGYDMYGCDIPHGYWTNYGTQLYDRLTALGIK